MPDTLWSTSPFPALAAAAAVTTTLRLRTWVAAVRAGVDPAPEVIVSAAGPKMTAAAGRVADRIALALGPTATEEDLETTVEAAREKGCPAMAFTQSMVGVGEALPSWFARTGGPTLAELRRLGSAGLLPADPGLAFDLLREREERLGITEVTVPGELAEAFAPMLARLRRSPAL